MKNQETFVECDGISAISDVLAPAFPPHEIETLIAAVDLLSCLALYDGVLIIILSFIIFTCKIIES